MKKDVSPSKAAHTLKSAGISTTQRRLAVLNILQQASRPLSVGDIRRKLDPVSSVDHIEINISGLCNGCLHATKLQNKTLKKEHR